MIDRIATGGMGVVWLARDERLQRLVAIKQLVLQPGLSTVETDDLRRRALREARIAARLQHPNAVMVFDVTQHQAQPCLVMEYLPSRSLATVVAERGPLPYREVAEIGQQAASALAAAHAADIVHRDVKPGNVLIGESGVAKITDFGISRAPGDVTITQTGLVAGTPAYLAPEVARGQEPTPAADVFSLGATLYAAVEGQGPFGVDDNQLALLHTVAAGNVQPPRAAGVFTPVLQRLLAPRPEARPTMQQACVALAEFLGSAPETSAQGAVDGLPTPHSSNSRSGATVRARPGSRGPLRGRRAAPRAGVLVAAGAIVLAVAGFGAAALLEQDETQRTRAAPQAPQSTRTTSEPTAQQAVPVDLSEGPIEWSAAGQLVIDYYAGAAEPTGSWEMLTARAQHAFGGRENFRAYWDQYTQVYAQDAYGVTVNGNGSVNVPVEVIYHTESGQRREQRVVRVTRQDGQLLIDTKAL